MAGADFTVRDFLDWARTKPADQSYSYRDCGTCALGQFAREVRGFSLVEAQCEDYASLVSRQLRDAALGVGERYRHHIRERWTFGRLVARLEALIPASSDTWTKLDAYLTDIEQVSA